MNLIDSIVAAIAPEAGLRRAQARARLGAVTQAKRAYEGAQKGRRTQGWRTSSAGPITEIHAGRIILRDRSRDLVRNNAWGHRAVAIKVANQIGTGIRPRAATASAELNARIDTLHTAWAASCAPESGGDLYAAQALAARARCESGESLVMLDRVGGNSAGIPLLLQVLEADWIADDLGTTATTGSGWREGIRFDASGRRAAYRLWSANPNETGWRMLRDTREVPAGDVVHLFRTERPGQLRGVPDLASVMLRLRDLDDYHDAALMLAKVQAVLGAFVTQPGGPSASPLGTESTDAAGNRLEELAPGIVAYLAPGEDVKFLSPQGGGPFAEYTRTTLHLIAAGFGITYHQLTGDLSQANYSSLRAGSLEFRRQVEQDQHLLLIPALCQPIWNAFIAAAVTAGALPLAAANAPAHWTPPRFELVDPIRDTEAIKAQIRAGLVSWPEAVSEMGYDPATQLTEIADWATRMRKAGVVLDTDPSLTTANGQAVNPAATSAVVLNSEQP
jgi:lambda family phage portal protein